jgi:hypothetical protein
MLIFLITNNQAAKLKKKTNPANFRGKNLGLMVKIQLSEPFLSR